MSDNMEIATRVFEKAQTEGLTRDQTLITMIQEGIPSLNMAQNLYKDIAKATGLTQSRSSRKGEALEFIAASGVDVLDEEARLQLKADIVSNFNVAPGTAHDYIRAWAAQAGIELNLGGPIGQNNEEIYEFIAQNPGMEKEQFREFMEQLGRSSGNIDETWRGVKLARRLIAEGRWANVDLSQHVA